MNSKRFPDVSWIDTLYSSLDKISADSSLKSSIEINYFSKNSLNHLMSSFLRVFSALIEFIGFLISCETVALIMDKN